MIYYKENLVQIVNQNNVMKLDFKDWIMTSDDCNDNIEKWLKFKSGDYPDPDCVLKMSDSNSDCVAVKLGWYSKNDKHSIDCIFSFATFFKAFLRYYAGEYMPCPDNKYNAIKGNYFKYKDRLEKLYVDIKDSSKTEFMWSDWFSENCEKDKLCIAEILESQNLFAFDFKGNKMEKKHIEPYTNYIGTVNDIIEKR